MNRTAPKALAILIAGAALLTAQTPTFQTGSAYGRQAYVIENGKIRLSALRGGGHIVELRMLSADPKLGINPFYVPQYQTIEPYEYDQAKHGAFYGSGANRFLDAGYMGQLLCFPNFGPTSSEDEIRNGLGFHGEALAVEWKQPKPPLVDSKGVTLYYSADLPRSQYRVERIVRMPAGSTVVHVEEWIENLAAFDRPFNRNEHVTLGAPFVAVGKNYLDLSGTYGVGRRGRTAANLQTADAEIQWPRLADNAAGRSADLRAFEVTPKTSLFRSILLDPSRDSGYFTAYNTEYPVLIGYVFPRAENPWICDWQENQSGQATPRLGKVVARGIEFGTSAFDEGVKRSVQRGSMFGVPVYGWIPGRGRLKTSYTIFLAEIPTGFAGVSDVQLEPGQIVITERETKRQFKVPSGDQP